MIHGGGWAAGNKEVHNAQTWQLVQAGFVSATVGYRFAPKHVFPAQVQDVKCAVRFLRAHAKEYGINPDQVGAIGFSAGAHLSMMLGTMDKEDGLDDSGGSPAQSSKVQAVVSYFGPTDLAAEYPARTVEIFDKFFGGSKAQKSAEYKQASPLTYVNKGDAPMLLFQGTNDVLVPWMQAVEMVEAMQKAGVPGRAELLSGLGHGWGQPEMQRTWDESVAFFKLHLKPQAQPKKVAGK